MTPYLVTSLPKIPYIYTVYDPIFGYFPAKNTVHIHRIYCLVVSNHNYKPEIACNACQRAFTSVKHVRSDGRSHTDQQPHLRTC